MAENIPDLEKLTNDLLNFIEFYDKPETQKTKETNVGYYNYLINDKFKNLPFPMIRLLEDQKNRKENLAKIIEMINILKNVKSGQTSLENAENEFVEKRAEEYLYPAFGGKDNFYKVAEENKLKNNNKKVSTKSKK